MQSGKNPRKTGPEASRHERVHVQVKSILPLSESSWQIQWTETAEPIQLGLGETTSWQAILTVEEDPPETTETLLTNPLGLYVEEITWTQTL